jgi:hypothetical protein
VIAMHHCVPIDGAAHRASLTLLVSTVSSSHFDVHKPAVYALQQ